jgi:hypothetical protein
MQLEFTAVAELRIIHRLPFRFTKQNYSALVHFLCEGFEQQFPIWWRREELDISIMADTIIKENMGISGIIVELPSDGQL